MNQGTYALSLVARLSLVSTLFFGLQVLAQSTPDVVPDLPDVTAGATPTPAPAPPSAAAAAPSASPQPSLGEAMDTHPDTPPVIPITRRKKAPPPPAPKNDERLYYVLGRTVIQLYGHLDLSFDATTKGIAGRQIVAGDPSNPYGVNPGPGGAYPGIPTGVYTAQGNMGWVPQIASNSSFFGIKGTHTLTPETKVVFQIESQLDMSATPGTSDNNASADGAVKGAFASRNSFLGISSSWGSLKIGKSDTPYKISTGKLDPFSSTVGDYNAIMGNTGGDNRVEFDARAPHAIWYESPPESDFAFDALYSPGQNRTDDNDNIPAGEPSCSGGNNPIGGGLECGDGSYGDLASVAISYKGGNQFFITGAAEIHTNVNRTADETEFGGGAPLGSVGVANEWAYKAGIQYTLPTRTTIDAIYENFMRYAINPNFNERQRMGTWLAITQKFSDTDAVNLGWAHAGATPGDPGDPTVVDPNGTTFGGHKANSANLFAAGYVHTFQDRKTTMYVVYAQTVNESGAHYDMGASGHGITTDCHDGGMPVGGFSGGGGTCFTGSTLQAASIGMTHEF